ncbi:MAG: 4-hydroxy-tetrahydrodipicolinate synthase [Acidimicrobiia bacterium]
MFKGIYVPVVTPFHSDGTLDEVSLAKLCESLVEKNIAGLLPLGTTGEASSLNAAERALVVETCSKAIAGTSTQLVIGAGTNSTATTIERVKEYESYSPDGFLIVTPYYVRPSEEGILAHFEQVADVANGMDADVMLYNIPARSGRYVSTNGLLSAAKHERIKGVKQAVGGIDEETIKLLSNADENFSVLGGDDAFIAPICMLGGKGGVCASAHIATGLWVEMVDAVQNGDFSHALEIHKALVPVVNAGFGEPNPVVFKGALAAMGVIESDFVRLPLLQAKNESISSLIKAANAKEIRDLS